MGQSYFPSRQGDLDSWEESFIAMLPQYKVELGLTDAEVDFMTTTITKHRNTFKNVNQIKAMLAEAMQLNESTKTDTLSIMSNRIAYIKALTNYKEYIGKGLQIISSGVDAQSKVGGLSPELSVTVEGGLITIKFKKSGHAGVRIYCKRGNETEFTFLAVDTSSPYVDNRPNLNGAATERREYYAFFFDKDEQVGEASSIVTIVF
jgi:hypothetical protein